jgi:hypothetical protein
MPQVTTGLKPWLESRSRRTALPVIVLVASVPFLGGLLTGRMYTGCAGPPEVSDACVMFEPWMTQALRAVAHGELPLWNPYQGLGAPLLANMQSALLWPLSAAYLVLPFPLALVAVKGSRLALTGIFTFLFLTRLGCRVAPATIGAIAFMWSSFNVLWLYNPQGHYAMVMALVFWMIEETFAARTRLAPIGLAAAVGLGWLGGHPGTYVHVLLAAGLYYAWKLWDVREPGLRVRRAVQGSLAVGAGLGLAAVQLLPFAEYLAYSEASHRGAIPENPFLQPFHLPLLWVPDLLGNYPIAYPVLADFGHGYYTHERNYAEATTGYVGLTCAFLAFVAVGWRWTDRRVRILAGVALWSVAAAFGLPGVRTLFLSVPLLTQSHPNRGLFVHAFAVTALAALALSDPGLRRVPARRWWRAFGGVLALVGVTSGLGIWLAWAGLKDQGEYLRYLKWVALVTIANASALGLVVALRRSPGFMWAVGLVVLVETVGHGAAMLHPQPPEKHFPDTPMIRYLKAHLGLHRFAVLSAAKLVPPDLATHHGLAQLEQRDALLVRATVDAVRGHMTGSLPDGTKELEIVGKVDADFLRLIGVRFGVTEVGNDLRGRVAANGAPTAVLVPVFSVDRLALVRTMDELPRAFVLRGAVEDVARRPVADLVAAARTAAAIEQYGSTVVTVRLPPGVTAGTLILSDAFYPGWRATVDGRPVPVHQVRAANLRAVPVPAGAEFVTFHYAPGSVRWGLLVSGLTLGTLVGTAVVVRRQER